MNYFESIKNQSAVQLGMAMREKEEARAASRVAQLKVSECNHKITRLEKQIAKAKAA